MDVDFKKFQKEADALAQAINRINESNEVLKSRYIVSLNKTVNESDREQAAKEITILVEQLDNTKDAIRKRLVRIAGENREFVEAKNGKTAQARIRIATHTNLAEKFIQAVSRLDRVHTDHRNEVKRDLKSHLQALNPHAEEEDIDIALKMGKMNQIVQESKTLDQMDPYEKQRLLNGLADLQSRNNDIMELARNINELSALFHELHVLVVTQNDLLNNVEYNIDETKVHAEKAVEELVEAHSYQRSAGKKKMIVFVLIVVLILCISIPILIKYIPIWTKKTEGNSNSVSSSGGGSNNGTEAVGSVTPTVKRRISSNRFRGIGEDRGQVVSAIDVQRLLEDSIYVEGRS